MTNDEVPNDERMTNVELHQTNGFARVAGVPDAARQIPATTGRVFDLEERTSRFGEAIIDFAKKVPVNPVTTRLIAQLVGAGTSVGANYCEADDAVSKKDFRHKISISKREARETKFFIRMVVRAVPELREEAKPLWLEAKELHLIFSKIYRSK